MALKKTNKTRTKTPDLREDNITIIRDTTPITNVIEELEEEEFELSNVVPIRKTEKIKTPESESQSTKIVSKTEDFENKTTIDPKKFGKVYVGVMIVSIIALVFLI